MEENLAKIVNIFNLSSIVMGGGLSGFGNLFIGIIVNRSSAVLPISQGNTDVILDPRDGLSEYSRVNEGRRKVEG